jgi:hypothetical protein
VLLEAARRKKKKGSGKKRKGENDDFMVDDEEHAEGLGGWLECERCCASFHWVSGLSWVCVLTRAGVYPSRAAEEGVDGLQPRQRRPSHSQSAD